MAKDLNSPPRDAPAGAAAVFDRRRVAARRRRAAARFSEHDFLFREVAERLGERLALVRREFRRVLMIGGRGPLAPLGALGPEEPVVIDLCPECLGGRARAVVADEEFLPFAEGHFDLVISNLALHWVNDLPGVLVQARRALKPDGLFLAAMFGGETLGRVRDALMRAELELGGGAGSRFSPLADIRDVGHLMQRAGFALPVVDADTINVSYPTLLQLFRDLRGMGEGAAPASGSIRSLNLDILQNAEARCRSTDGTIAAAFQVLYLTGWAFHPDQPRPLKPGSATARLADALGTTETAVKG